MFGCDEDKKNENCKGDEDMINTLPGKSNKKKLTPKRMIISNKRIEDLLKGKSVIHCEDGVAKIDSSHSDYNFWMED